MRSNIIIVYLHINILCVWDVYIYLQIQVHLNQSAAIMYLKGQSGLFEGGLYAVLLHNQFITPVVGGQLAPTV